MKRTTETTWLDKAITQTAPGPAPKPDYTSWCRAHAPALAKLRQRGRKYQVPLPLWRIIMESKVTKIAAVVILIVGALGLAQHLRRESTHSPSGTARQKQIPDQGPSSTTPNILDKELALAKALKSRADIQGLLALLDSGSESTKILVAAYLGEIGDASALPLLAELAEQWQESHKRNPFQAAIEAIEQQDQNKTPAPEPNQSLENSPMSVLHQFDKSETRTTITGIVIDADSLRPLSGAIVSCKRTNKTTTDAQGQFTLDVKEIFRGSLYIKVQASGYATERMNLSIKEGKTYKHTFKLGPGFKLMGVVKDTNDQPIKSATVRVLGIGMSVIAGKLSTRVDGKFAVDGLNPEEYYQVSVEHPDYVSTSVHLPSTPAGQTCYRDIVLTKGSIVFGQVTDKQGKPISGVQVGRNQYAQVKTTSDAKGQYKLENVPQDERTIWAAHEKYALYVQSLYLPDDISECRVDLQLDEPSPLHGQVVDQTGNPVPGVRVSIHEYEGVSHLWRRSYTSDSQGHFVIPNTPKQGALRLSAYKEGITSDLSEINLGEQECIITVSQVGCIYGKVVDHVTEKPIQKFTVKLRSERGGYPSSWAKGLSNSSEEGYFDTEGAGLALHRAFSVTILADDYKPLVIDPVRVQPFSSDPNRVVFRLERAAPMAGRVIDSDGSPIPGAKISVFSKINLYNRSDWLQVTSDEDGVFVLSGMEPELHCLHVTAEDYVAFAGLLKELVIDKTQLKDIALDVGVHIWGYVYDDQGEPMEGAHVTAFNNSAIQKREPMREALDGRMPKLAPQTQTNQEGYYELSGVSIGRVGVSVTTPKKNQSSGYKNIITHPGDTLEINFGNEVGFHVEGMVRVDRQPLVGATVELETRGRPRKSKSARTGTSGTFRIRGLSPGEYQLGVRSFPQPGSSARQQRHLYHILSVHQDLKLDIDMESESVLEVGNGTVRGSIPPSLQAQSETLEIWAARSIDLGPNPEEGVTAWEKVSAKFDVKPDGTFVGEEIGAGLYQLVLLSDQRIIAQSDVIALSDGESLSDIAFDMGTGELSIQVTDAHTFQGIPNAHFRLSNHLGFSFRAEELIPEEKHLMQVGNQGRCLFDRLPEGQYHVKAWAPGYLLGESKSKTVQGKQITPLVVALYPAASIHFELSDALLQEATGNYIMVDCQVFDVGTHNAVQNKNLYNTTDRHICSMHLTEKGDWELSNAISLPEGNYAIDYTVRSFTIENRVPKGPGQKLTQGKATVTCQSNQTTSVLISE